MADINKSKADLLLDFANNTSGDIAPADQRNLVESLHPSFGGLAITPAGALETTISSAGVFVLGAGTTAATNLHRFTASAAGRLTYTGLPTVHSHIACSFTVTDAGNNKDLGVKIAKNGIVDDASQLDFFMGTGAQKHAAATHIDFNLETDDYIELWVANETDTTNLTLTRMYLFAMTMFT